MQHLQSKSGYAYKSSGGEGLPVCKNHLFHTRRSNKGQILR